jgi:hypothetical protein
MFFVSGQIYGKEFKVGWIKRLNKTLDSESYIIGINLCCRFLSITGKVYTLIKIFLRYNHQAKNI